MSEPTAATLHIHYDEGSVKVSHLAAGEDIRAILVDWFYPMSYTAGQPTALYIHMSYEGREFVIRPDGKGYYTRSEVPHDQ